MRVRRLAPDEPQEPLLALYADHPGSYFDPGQRATGLYFGVEEGERLVAVAGTHVLAPGEGIAVVGNAVTRADARGRGYAQACTSALVAALHAQECRVVALQVSAGNAAAITAYRRAGFSFRSVLWQTGLALRRPPWVSGTV